VSIWQLKLTCTTHDNNFSVETWLRIGKRDPCLRGADRGPNGRAGVVHVVHGEVVSKDVVEKLRAR
jgi:hypothetical protein